MSSIDALRTSGSAASRTVIRAALILLASTLLAPARGAETVMYSFQGQGAGDGAMREAALIDVGGMLYGTTENGGTNGFGTVFVINP
jgi:uncharacterized repeat protein (TIGR03803 family)